MTVSHVSWVQNFVFEQTFREFFATFFTPMFAQQAQRVSNNSGKVPKRAFTLVTQAASEGQTKRFKSEINLFSFSRSELWSVKRAIQAWKNYMSGLISYEIVFIPSTGWSKAFRWKVMERKKRNKIRQSTGFPAISFQQKCASTI